MRAQCEAAVALHRVRIRSASINQRRGGRPATRGAAAERQRERRPRQIGADGGPVTAVSVSLRLSCACHLCPSPSPLSDHSCSLQRGGANGPPRCRCCRCCAVRVRRRCRGGGLILQQRRSHTTSARTAATKVGQHGGGEEGGKMKRAIIGRMHESEPLAPAPPWLALRLRCSCAVRTATATPAVPLTATSATLHTCAQVAQGAWAHLRAGVSSAPLRRTSIAQPQPGHTASAAARRAQRSVRAHPDRAVRSA